MSLSANNARSLLVKISKECDIPIHKLYSIAKEFGVKPKDKFVSKDARELAHQHDLKDTDIKSTRDDDLIGINCVRIHLGKGVKTNSTIGWCWRQEDPFREWSSQEALRRAFPYPRGLEGHYPFWQ
jgi:hypothetical protein